MPKDYSGESVIEMLSWIRPEFHISEKMSDQGRDFALRIIFSSINIYGKMLPMDCPNCGSTITSEFDAWICDVSDCKNWLCINCDMQPEPRKVRLCHEHQDLENKNRAPSVRDI